MADTNTAVKILTELSTANHALTEGLAMPDRKLLASEVLVLAVLKDSAGRTPSTVAGLLGLSKGRITHLVDALSGRGYITRRADPVDRRRTLLSLTPEGEDVAVIAARRLAELDERFADVLGTAGPAMLVQQLRQVRRAASQR